jgi:hypothetical protein
MDMDAGGDSHDPWSQRIFVCKFLERVEVVRWKVMQSCGHNWDVSKTPQLWPELVPELVPELWTEIFLFNTFGFLSIFWKHQKKVEF